MGRLISSGLDWARLGLGLDQTWDVCAESGLPFAMLIADCWRSQVVVGVGRAAVDDERRCSCQKYDLVSAR